VFNDEDRRDLYDALEASIGSRPAATMMAHLPPVGFADLATRADLDGLRSELRGEMAGLRGEMAELRAEVRSQLPKLIAANIASMVGVAGLVLAAASLAN
jgi:hypothetical protein